MTPNLIAAPAARTHNNRLVPPVAVSTLVAMLAASGLVSCTVGSGQTFRSDEASLTLEQAELADELRTSPVRYSDVAFTRISIMLDAVRADAVEFSTSLDGHSWSAWRTLNVRHVEANTESHFNGEITLANEAMYYRLRGDATAASHVRIDLLGANDAFDWESGTNQEEADEHELAAFANPRAFPGAGFRYVTRAQWGATRDGCSTAIGQVRRITIHHTDTPATNPEARVRQVQSYHKNNRGWCDVGYHFLVDEAGTVYEGRRATLQGAHAAGANSGNLGIALIGSYQSKEPSAAQLKAVAQLVAALADKHNINLSRSTLKGHREVGTTSTDCPGNRTFAKLASVIDAAAQGPGSEDPGADPADPSEPDPNDPAQPAALVDVSGFVYENNDPSDRVAGATVEIDGKTATTSATGSFTVRGVTAAILQVKVTKSGYTAALVQRDVANGAAVSVGIFASAQPNSPTTGSATVQGVVYRGGDASNRVANATVTFSNGRTITTNSSGYYIIYNMPAGSLTITAAANGDSASVTRNVVNGASNWGSVDLQ